MKDSKVFLTILLMFCFFFYHYPILKEIHYELDSKILFKLFEAGIEPKDFENLYKGFTLGQNDIKENEMNDKKVMS